nr:MAG TPA: hypothetical protein [Caudoviricetes sp.]
MIYREAGTNLFIPSRRDPSRPPELLTHPHRAAVTRITDDLIIKTTAEFLLHDKNSAVIERISPNFNYLCA